MPSDKYKNFEELSANEREGKDFSIKCVNRNSGVTIVAIHAGTIEPGAGRIADEIAANNYNLYKFEGHKSAETGHAEELHITSTNFRERKLVDLLLSSEICISIHGSLDMGERKIRYILTAQTRRLWPQ